MSSAPQTLHLACAVEGGYDVHSAVLLHSATCHVAPARLHTHFLHGPNHSAHVRDQIREMLEAADATVSFHRVDPDRLVGLRVINEFTAAMWFRIFLPELVDADRVLYVDCDAVVAGDLTPLLEVDLADKALGAVRNVFQHNHLHRLTDLGFEGPEAYFNSGVLLINLDLWREMDATELLQATARRRGDSLEWPDQDVLNLVFRDRWLAMHPRWNVMNSMRFPHSGEVFGSEILEEARRHPVIRHFEGPGENKPWHYGCRRDDRDLYFRHRRETPWPDVRLTGGGFKRVLRGVKNRITSGSA